MAQLAESIVKEELDKRQLWLNFDTEPELKQKSEEYAKELSPQAERRGDSISNRTVTTGCKMHIRRRIDASPFSARDRIWATHGLFSANIWRCVSKLRYYGHAFSRYCPGHTVHRSLKLVNASELGLLIDGVVVRTRWRFGINLVKWLNSILAAIWLSNSPGIFLKGNGLTVRFSLLMAIFCPTTVWTLLPKAILPFVVWLWKEPLAKLWRETWPKN